MKNRNFTRTNTKVLRSTLIQVLIDLVDIDGHIAYWTWIHFWYGAAVATFTIQCDCFNVVVFWWPTLDYRCGATLPFIIGQFVHDAIVVGL